MMLNNIFVKGLPNYVALLREFVKHRSEVSVPVNNYFSNFDALCLHNMIAKYRPKKYVEIGSGFSTLVASRAISLYGLDTKIISIDPEPRTQVDEVCSVVYRRLLNMEDVGWITTLKKGDIIFIDASHQLLDGSDVAIFFLEILPRLQPGVIVQLHDIYLPRAYPHDWEERQYSEQYALAIALVFGQTKIHVLLPNGYISVLQSYANEFGVGKSFWFEVQYHGALYCK